MQNEIQNNTDNESVAQTPHERQNITISLSQELYEQLREKSATEDKSISTFAEELITSCLNRPNEVKLAYHSSIPTTILSQENQLLLEELIFSVDKSATFEMGIYAINSLPLGASSENEEEDYIESMVREIEALDISKVEGEIDAMFKEMDSLDFSIDMRQSRIEQLEESFQKKLAELEAIVSTL